MAAPERRLRCADAPAWTDAAQAMYLAAQAVAGAGGAGTLAALVEELRKILHVATVFVAVFTDTSRSTLRTLAAVLDGKSLDDFEFPLEGSPWAQMVGRAAHFAGCGIAAEITPGTMFASEGMDSHAALPLNDAGGSPVGLLVAMDRKPLPDPALAEALLKIFASRILAEIERNSADQALRAAALAVSAAVERVESMLRIFGGRAAAEIDQPGAREALQAQEQKYRAIFDGSVDSMVLWSQELRTVDVNQAFVRMTGMTREQVVGKHWTERPDAQDMERLVGYIEAALQGRETQAVEPVTRGDGASFLIELRYLPVQLGDTPYVLGVGRDVSERIVSERALRANEAQYRGIFNASADALVLRASDFSIVDANATYERMSGYRLDEVVGVDRVLANPPEVAATIRRLHEQALAGEQIRLETELVRRDGQRYDLELRGVPILHHGEPHVLYIGRDMTQSKRAERALRNSEEQYRAIFNASADGLVVRDADYRAVDVNPAYLSMSGYSRDEVLSATRVLTQPDKALQERHREQHSDILAGRAVRFEVPGVRKDGSHFYLEVNGMPLTYRGEPHVLYAARDITERRAAEAERERLEAQLRQAQKMEAIGQLTGGIAHDFNNILTSVIGYLVLGLERAETLGDARLQHQLGQAHIAAQRARELIAQMLAFARRQRGQRRTLALAPLVDQTLQLLRATLPSSVSLEFAAPPATGGRELHVAVDAVHLEQVLFNLCINARDAISGSGWIRVRLGRSSGGWMCASCRAQVDAGRWVELSVADSGSGIAPDLIDRIFEPFTSSKEVGRGSGMGLAMVHGIVHDHGGHVIVETSLGAGSVFRVMLPPASGTEVDTPDAPAAAAAGEALCARVMVVDDEVMVGDFMVELLSGWGIEVVLHRSPLEALAWLGDPGQPLDLLITDQTMPQLGGLQLAQRATDLRPGLPVLLYTGNAESVDEAEAKHHGVSGVLHKPVDNRALRALLDSWLRRGHSSASHDG